MGDRQSIQCGRQVGQRNLQTANAELLDLPVGENRRSQRDDGGSGGAKQSQEVPAGHGGGGTVLSALLSCVVAQDKRADTSHDASRDGIWEPEQEQREKKEAVPEIDKGQPC